MTIENSLLKDQILNYENLILVHQKQDSLRLSEITVYKDELQSTNNQLKKVKTSQKRIIIGSTFGSIVLFILGLII